MQKLVINYSLADIPRTSNPLIALMPELRTFSITQHKGVNVIKNLVVIPFDSVNFHRFLHEVLVL